MKCHCPDPSLCQRLGFHVIGRLWEIWNCTCDICTEEMCEAYRQKWENEAMPMEDQPANEPSGWDKVANLASAYVRWKAAGSPITPPEEEAKRREICNVCDNREPKTDKCKLCGCGLSKAPFLVSMATGIPGKLQMATESCPDGRWQAFGQSK